MNVRTRFVNRALISCSVRLVQESCDQINAGEADDNNIPQWKLRDAHLAGMMDTMLKLYGLTAETPPLLSLPTTALVGSDNRPHLHISERKDTAQRPHARVVSLQVLYCCTALPFLLVSAACACKLCLPSIANVPIAAAATRDWDTLALGQFPSLSVALC